MAYWDTEQAGRPPRLLGEIQGTPTIRLFKPKKKQSKKGSHAEKTVVDYRQERKVKDMQQFVEDQMPNYVERIVFENDFHKVQAKASKYGLAQAIFFTTKPQTTAVLKFLSTEFRRRLLIVHVPPTTKNQQWIQEFGVTVPSLVIVTSKGERISYTGGDFTRRKLERFLKEYATVEPVYTPVQEESVEPDQNKESESEKEKEKIHVEL